MFPLCSGPACAVDVHVPPEILLAWGIGLLGLGLLGVWLVLGGDWQSRSLAIALFVLTGIGLATVWFYWRFPLYTYVPQTIYVSTATPSPVATDLYPPLVTITPGGPSTPIDVGNPREPVQLTPGPAHPTLPPDFPWPTPWVDDAGAP